MFFKKLCLITSAASYEVVLETVWAKKPFSDILAKWQLLQVNKNYCKTINSLSVALITQLVDSINQYVSKNLHDSWKL